MENNEIESQKDELNHLQKSGVDDDVIRDQAISEKGTDSDDNDSDREGDDNDSDDANDDANDEINDDTNNSDANSNTHDLNDKDSDQKENKSFDGSSDVENTTIRVCEGEEMGTQQQKREESDLSDGDSSVEGEGQIKEKGDGDIEEEKRKKIPTDEYGRELSAYEIMRLERIQRNKAYLAQLGLEEEKSEAKISYEKKLQQKKKDRKKKPVSDESLAERRQSMARKSKAKEVDYSGDLKNIFKIKQNEEKVIVKSQPEVTPRKGKRKHDQVPLFIYREFKHIIKCRHKAVATGKRLVKAAELEYRVAKRNVGIHERKEKRRMEKEGRKIAHETKKLLLPTIQELGNRRVELKKAKKEFEAWQHEILSTSLRSNAKTKAAFIDAKIGFPLAVQRNERMLGLMLCERLIPQKEDTGKAKLKSSPTKTAGKTCNSTEIKAVIKSTKKLKPTKSSSNTYDSIDDISEKSISLDGASIVTKKANQIIKARNIGGPITPSLSSCVQRKWLERDVPVPADVSNFVPQIGDTIL